MVRGLEIFRERFRRFEGDFVLIGGAACDQGFADNRLESRATKDLDMVLIVEILNRDFVATMWAFIEDGSYERNPQSSISNPRSSMPPLSSSLGSPDC